MVPSYGNHQIDLQLLKDAFEKIKKKIELKLTASGS